MSHTLPPEILGLIFASAIPNHSHNSSDINSAPLLLLRVCQSWKRIALATPYLWTTLGLHCLSDIDPVTLISAFLRRSRALPIHVYISPLTWHYPLNPSVLKHVIIPEAMQLLPREFHRLRTLHTTNLPAVLQSLFPDGTRIDAPLLREFRITSAPKTSPGHVLAGHLAAPNLDFLELCDPHITLQAIAPDYHKLRFLRWNGSNASNSWHASLHHLLHLLRACPNLEQCHIIRPTPFEDFLGHLPPIQLPRLRHLSLLWKDTVPISRFLHLLHLPALHSLRLQLEPSIRIPTPQTNLQAVLCPLFPHDNPPPPLNHLHAVHLDTTGPFPLRALKSLHLEDCTLHSASLDETCVAELHLTRVDVTHAERLMRVVAAPQFRVLALEECRGVPPELCPMAVRGLRCGEAGCEP